MIQALNLLINFVVGYLPLVWGSVGAALLVEKNGQPLRSNQSICSSLRLLDLWTFLWSLSWQGKLSAELSDTKSSQLPSSCWYVYSKGKRRHSYLDITQSDAHALILMNAFKTRLLLIYLYIVGAELWLAVWGFLKQMNI